MTQFNPAINAAMTDTSCKRFAPREERSIFCRLCQRPFYQHSPSARKFDSVMEMHRAYLTDGEIIKWLYSIGPTLEEQLKVVNEILTYGVEVVAAPDLFAMRAIESVLKQLIIERDVDAKATPTTTLIPLTPIGEKVADGVRPAAETSDSALQASVSRAHAAQVQDESGLPIHAFD